MNKIEKLIELFHSEDYESAIRIFGDVESFYDYILSKGYFLDPNDEFQDDEFITIYITKLFQHKKYNDLNVLLTKLYHDFEIDSENNLILPINDLSDFSIFFCDDRNQPSKFIKTLLSDDAYSIDYYSNYNNEIHYIINELNVKNLNYLKSLMLSSLNGIEIDQDTKFLVKNNINTITSENIDTILSDNETIDFIFEEYLDELKSNLLTIDSYAQEGSYIDGKINEILSQLNREFGKITNDNESYFINISKNFVIDRDFLADLEYYGVLKGLAEHVKCLRIRDYDYYPDEYESSLNGYFLDEI